MISFHFDGYVRFPLFTRFGRGIKTLQGMLKDIKSGRSIIMDDVPQVLAPSTKTVVGKFFLSFNFNYN